MQSWVRTTTKSLLQDEDGLGMVELVVIIAIIVVIAIIFRNEITNFIKSLFVKASNKSEEIFK
ncbi:Flp1 family type IVb pilin [Paenibacillus sp. UMB4589-SE434]|uniref:Flp1 family type IVb pilin n=1 Tax=Paenibacillus sp. UMB4589-SE434 TaxID=3046314 RepID=UPI0025515FC7|nr:Flp1 family type IVb pilin [Paenibacillus sp. UMB4589-SE434]MDK8182921.1 Flp1 family type IVb pilin [Paenibacillus sp. UMB4589-SE434]